MPKTTSFGESQPIACVGPALQSLVPSAVHGLASSVGAGGNIISNLIQSDGYPLVSVGVKSTQAGQIQVQRYLDDAGLVPQGAAITASLTANTAAVCNVSDGLPFSSYAVTITNSGGSTATLSNLAILQQAA